MKEMGEEQLEGNCAVVYKGTGNIVKRARNAQSMTSAALFFHQTLLRLRGLEDSHIIGFYEIIFIIFEKYDS